MKLIKGQGLARLMAQTNYELLGMNFSTDMSEITTEEEKVIPQISQKFLDSAWYADIIFVLKILQAPLEYNKTKVRFLKLKAEKLCIVNGLLYWKDPRGILLSCLIEEDAERPIREFHKGDCGGHHYWKTTVHKMLRDGFYWPSIFLDVYKEVSKCHECQIFDGKGKLQSLPLKPISVEAPLRQWGLDFIGEIHPQSLAQHKWILTTIDYFTKWIEAIPTRQATYDIVIRFLEENILSRFGCLTKIIKDNTTTFKY